MDPGAREQFLASLSEFAARTAIPALVYVTHHIEEILPMFKKTLILKGGRVLYAGATREVMRRHLLNRLYGVQWELIKRRGRYWPLSK